MITIRETNMCDGIDLIHRFTTKQEAIESGRFDFYFEKLDCEDEDDIEEIEILENLEENGSLEEYVDYFVKRNWFFQYI